LENAEKLRPDVVIHDMSMAEPNGLAQDHPDKEEWLEASQRRALWNETGFIPRDQLISLLEE